MALPNAVIRPVEERDAEVIASIYAPSVTDSVISFELTPPDASEMARRIAATTQTYPWLVCESADSSVLGYVYASSHLARAAYQWSVNVTVYVDARCHRTGIGRALYTSLFELLRLQGFHNAYAGVTLPNAGSVGLHEAMGFRPVGIYRDVGYKMGAWWDVGWWSLALREKSGSPPAAPLAMSSVRALPVWNTALATGLDLLRPVV